MCFADVPGVRLLRILAACRGPLFLASETPRRIRKHASPSPRSRRGALLPTRTQMIGALGRNATVRIILLTLIGAPLITGSSGARAETPSPGVERSARITLNIPSQPLADAIYAYTAATGIEALAAGAILSDRRSSEVHGTLTADEALQAFCWGRHDLRSSLLTGSFSLDTAALAVSFALFRPSPDSSPQASMRRGHCPSRSDRRLQPRGDDARIYQRQSGAGRSPRGRPRYRRRMC